MVLPKISCRMVARFEVRRSEGFFMKYMLDTNICIYVQKNKNPNVLKKFKENFSQLGISVITYAELLVGVEKVNAKKRMQSRWKNLSSIWKSHHLM